MKSMAKYLLLMVCGILAAGHGHAQMIYDTLQLLELHVIADKVNYNETTKHTSIDSLYKKQSDHMDLGELLSAATPIFIRSYGKGTLATASFRGTGSSHTQVLWNGFRLNSPMLGQTDLSTIPNSLFDKVELYYGGASLIKSEGGLGGSINLMNNTSSQKPTLYLTQSAGSFKTFSTAAGLHLGKKSFKSDTRFIYQTSKNDFPFYNDAVIPPREMTQQNADYRNTGFTQHFSYRPAENHTLSFSTWNQWNDRNIPPVMSNYEQVNWLLESSSNFFSRNILGWDYKKKRTQTSVKAAYFFDDYRYNQELIAEVGSDTDSIISSINKSTGIFLNAKLVQDLRKGFVITAVMNVEHNDVESNNYSEPADRNSIGLVGKAEKLFWKRLNVSLLIRAQVVDGELLPLMPVLGLNFKILTEEQLYLRISFSRNYHLPTLNDLFWYPGGNPGLEPEDSFEVEGGLNYVLNIKHTLSLKADLTAFANRVNNWILWEDGGHGYWSPVNKAEVFARGMEFYTQLDARQGRSWFRVFVQYAYTRTTDENDNTDEQLIYIPRHTANGFFQWSYLGWSLDWKSHLVGEQNTISRTLPAYLINDVGAGKLFRWNANTLEVRFRVNNLLDVNYQTVLWRPMPGRNYELLVSFQLKRKQ
jgi:iron complex outermembrane receptor protein